MADTEVEILIKLRDEVTQGFEKVVNTVKSGNDEMVRESEKAQSAFQSQTDNLIALGNVAASVDRIFSSYTTMQIRVENSTERVTGAQERLSDAQLELNKLTNSGTASAEDLTKAQTAVERASRSLTISQNNLKRTQDAVIGTYINMGIQSVTLIGSFGKIKVAILGIKNAIVALEASTVILLAIAAAVAIVAYTFNQYQANQQAVIDKTEELKYANDNLAIAKQGVVIATEDIIKSQLEYADALDVVAKREGDVEKAEKDLKKIRAELLILQKGLADQADNWAKAIGKAGDYIRGVIQGQTEAEATLLRDIERQRHEVNLAKVDGDEIEIASAEKKLSEMEMQHQILYEDTRRMADAELNIIQTKTQNKYLAEEENIKATQQLYVTGYGGIGAFLETLYYPKLQILFEESNKKEKDAYNDMIDAKIDAIDRLLDAEIALKKSQDDAEVARQKIIEAKENRDKAEDNVINAEQQVNNATINLNNAQTTADKGLMGTTFGQIIMMPIIAVNEIINSIGKIFGFADGGPVTQTGLALVHKGEYVIPSDGVDGNDFGGGLTIIIEGDIYGTDPDQIAEVLAKKMRQSIRI